MSRLWFFWYSICLCTYAMEQTYYGTLTAVSPDGILVAIAATQSLPKSSSMVSSVYDTHTGNLIAYIPGKVTSFAQRQKLVVSLEGAHTIAIYNYATQEKVKTFDGIFATFVGENLLVARTSIDADIYTISDWELSHSFCMTLTPNSLDALTSTYASRNSRVLAITTPDHITAYDLSTSMMLWSGPGVDGIFSYDGSLLGTEVISDRGPAVDIHSLTDGKKRFNIYGSPTTFSPDNQLIAVTQQFKDARDTIVHDAQEGHPRRVYKGRFIQFSPDSKKALAILASQKIGLYNLETGITEKEFDHDADVSFLPTGALCVQKTRFTRIEP